MSERGTASGMLRLILVVLAVLAEQRGSSAPVPATVPVLLLDVDGVLNPFAAPECPPGFCEQVFFPGEEPVRYCELHGRWIRALMKHFDVVWATGWGEDANRVLSPALGLPQFPVVTFPPVPFTPAQKVPPSRGSWNTVQPSG